MEESGLSTQLAESLTDLRGRGRREKAEPWPGALWQDRPTAGPVV